MTQRTDLTQHLRDQIVAALHVGQLHSGDRLPSIREMADQLRKNARTVKAAYQALEQQGLVEVRRRSGVFVARQEVLGGETTQEMARWLGSVITDAWRRRVALSQLPQLLQQATASTRVLCGLVEYVEDAIVALRHELESDWGFQVRVVAPAALAGVHDVDFFAATSFCAPLVHDVAASLGKPLVALTVHDNLQQAIRSRLREGSLTVVAVDERFGERVRIVYAADESERQNVRLVLADDVDAVEALDPAEPVLLTRAARQRLGAVNVPMVFPHSPTLSAETAQALSTILVRRNLEANGRQQRTS